MMRTDENLVMNDPLKHTTEAEKKAVILAIRRRPEIEWADLESALGLDGKPVVAKHRMDLRD